MAIEKTIELNVETTQAQKALNKFGGTLEDVYGEGVQPLNFAIGELEDRLYEMAAAGNTSSKEFNEMAAEVGRMKKVIIETDMTLDGMAKTTSQKVGGAISGLAGGFTLAQGAMGAFGVESEAVQETLLRVQSAMAISEGITSITESIPDFKSLGASISKTAVGQKALNVAQIAGAKAMKVLNAVMKANPIMLIVGGIAALTGALYYFFSSSSDAKEANEELTRSFENQTKALEDNQKQVQKNAEIRRRLLVANGATEKQLHEDTLKRLKEEEESRIESLNSAVKFEEDKWASYRRLRKDGYLDEAKETLEEIKANKDKIKELKLQNKEYRTALTEENARYREHEKQEEEKAAQEESQQLKERRDRYKEYLQNRISARRLIEDLELELNENEINANNLKYERLIEDTKKNETLKQEEKQRIIDLYEQQRLEKENLIQQENRQKEVDNLNAFLEEKGLKQIKVNTGFLKQEIQSIDAIKQVANERDLKGDEENRNKKIQMANDALVAISGLVTAFAGDNEKAQKKAFQINKAISMGQAIMNTANAVTAALTAGGNPLKLATGAQFVEAGIAAATGAAQIATISRTKFRSGGGGIGGGTGGGVNAPNISQQAPTFNVVGDTGVNQLAQSLGSSPMKAYVVAGDVTTAQSLERNKIEQSKL